MKRSVFMSLIFLALPVAMSFAATFGVGPHILISMPREDFANVSSSGEGFGVKGHFDLKRLPGFSLRADLAFLSYGDKMQMATPNIFVQTRNEALQLSLGPQFMIKHNRFGAYFTPMVGIFNYSTIVTIPDLYYNYYNYSERKDSKTSWGWSVGAGVLYDIGLGPWVDVSTRYGKIMNIVETKVDDRVIKSHAVDISITIGVLFFIKR